ncbi:lantibiotic immunity ABC transporter MutG family permease subunit [Kyrpidia spormannii]|uniref:Lantibiotic immunity ABC transporter MutG family permease subunit n=1 Tax=Kyrpidia spormannii TaxID=2055160 RepID=A0A6F9E5C2_9BACL|nr:lantibiotic immunity ABC transporter MutG family permease subunit [Kyrpidia spormannii]CAB3391602.1 Lantibiotic immunity ABC transporter MutG family permease subunit [Kyrpidia spormannii]
MMNLFRAEWLKTKRTPIRWLTFFTPFLFVALMMGYFSLKAQTANVQISIFEVFFETWTVLAIPLGAGILSGFMIHQEAFAGSFHGFLGSQWPRRHLFLGKFSILVFLASTSTFMATLALIVGFDFISGVAIAWPIFVMAAILAMIGTLPLLAFHYWISFAWGFGASIGIGGVGLLIAALMATGLGDQVWPFVPWAWPVRLSMLAGAYLLDLLGMDFPPEIVSSGFVIGQIIKGLIPAAVLFVIMLVGGMIWFNRWEGRTIHE